MFGSACWGRNISKFDRGRLERIGGGEGGGGKEGEQVMLWESHWTVLRLYMKRDCTKNNFKKKKKKQILNDPMRHYFDSRSERFLLSRININCYKASFLPSALSVFNENYTPLRVGAHASAEDHIFPKEGGGCVDLKSLLDSFCFFSHI